MTAEPELPESTHTIVIGGGTGGATVAGLLAEHGGDPVLLLEAGPDYGALADRRWPAEVLDGRTLALSHDWGLTGATRDGDRELAFPRARLIGGCSSHNGCTAASGARIDYDRWAAAGNPGWSAADVEPLLALVHRRMQVRAGDLAAASPPHAAFIRAAQACGLPPASDLASLDAGVGVGVMAANLVDRLRFNAAFAFLDPVRDRPQLTIAGGILTESVLVEHGRARGVVVVADGRRRVVRAERVVLCAGAYGSPAVLLRSGIGPAASARRLGIDAVVDLPGVGEHLLDHPLTSLAFAGTEALAAALAAAAWAPDEQSLGHARSSRCDDGPYDMHVFLVSSTGPDLPPAMLFGGALLPRSRGRLELADTRPDTLPRIEPGYADDPEGHDVAVLGEARELLREIAAVPELAALIGPALPTPDTDLARTVLPYCHPAGTCRMGPASDPGAVVDARGQVHGVEGLHVADASLMPALPRGPINLPTAMVAARVSAELLGRSPGELAAAGSPGTPLSTP